jgi:glycosyltransferase involved in cell wall biosynthesis
MELKKEVSVVVPLYNEASNLGAFFSELSDAMQTSKRSYEVIFVDDGSTDGSYEILLDMAKKEDADVHVLSLTKNVGKAGALEQGFKLISGDIVVIMDCDLQYDPYDIEKLLDAINGGYDVVSGKRINRSDPRSVKLTSSIFRCVVSKLSGLDFSDYFSGFKCFKANVIESLGVYGDLNRIFSVYAFRAGFKVCEVPVTHRQRKYGNSRYNFINRLGLAVRDLLVLFFTVIVSREKHYKVGLLGIIFISLGLLTTLLSLFLSTFETVQDIFDNILVITGIILIFFGWQLRLIEEIGKSFLERHMGARIFEERDLRMENVKYITQGKKELFETRKTWNRSKYGAKYA